MNKKSYYITSLVLFLIFLASPALTAQAVGNAVPWRVEKSGNEILSASAQEQLSILQADETITVIVQLKQKAILPNGRGVGRAEQLSHVIETLTVTAERTQGPVKKLLDIRKSNGRVKKYSAFWIFNGFSVTATADVIDELARHPDVLSITPDQIDIVPASAPFALTNPEPNISLVNAPALWSMGYTGQGVVVASMDSGVSLSHADLANTWRGGSNSWYDPYGQHTVPADLSGHGTWTMGVMVGGDTGGSSIGVAPGAQWIAVKMFNDAGSSTATAIHQGYQWLLNPDSDPATADAPQVINNSWSFAYPGCFLDFEPDLQAVRAAGILPVFAAGNGGPGSNTSFSPANNPSAFAVGAIKSDSIIYGLSSRGPSTCGGRTGVFPEIVAPGHNIITTDLGGFYTGASGTSLSAPHVVGGLALLLSAYPGLSPAQQEDALQFSAFDLGAAGPDDYYGYGRLDLPAAYQWLASAPPTPISLPPTSTPTAVPATPTALPTFTATPLPTFTSTPPPTATPTSVPAFAVHIGDLDRTSVSTSSTKWKGTVTVYVHNHLDKPVAGVTVYGSWTNGASGNVFCVTNKRGKCSISKTGLSKNITSISFNVTNLSLSGYIYQSTANHDPDSDSNGTIILIPRP